MTISLEQTQAAARDAADRDPNKLNPMIGNVCVYTSPDDSEDHCFAGQILVDLNLPLPEHNIGISTAPHLPGLFTQDALVFLAQCQYEADMGEQLTPDKWSRQARRKPWREAYESACLMMGRLP